MTNYLPSLDEQFGAQQADLQRRIATLEQQFNHLVVPAAQAVPPSVNGLLAWNFDPVMADSTDNPSTGNALMMKIYIPAGPVTNICAYVGSNGTGLVSGQNFAGLYDTGGNRLAITVDQTTAWGSNGPKVMALTSPITVAGGFYYVSLLPNMSGGSTPKFTCAPSPPASTFPGAAGVAPYRFGNLGLGTSLPATITLSSMSNLNSQATWVGIS